MKQTSITILLYFLYNSCIFSQPNFLNTAYKYYPGISSPEPAWNEKEYNDTSWLTGTGAIGYGDITFDPVFIDSTQGYPSVYNMGDTIIDTGILPVTSLYLRYHFMINPEDTINLNGMVLDVYFDDGFIAFLNGEEFARSNMGKKGEPAEFNSLADRAHESPIASGDVFPVPGYFINKDFLDDHLDTGNNVLAVEIHNDSLEGSDLFLKCGLYKSMYDTIYDPIIDFWGNAVWRDLCGTRAKTFFELDSTELPLILIETDEYGIPFRHYEVMAQMKVIDQGAGKYNSPRDTNFTYDGNIRIEVRGGSSSYFPKQPFNIETQNPDGSNNNVTLLDMPPENDWRLIGPISDRSLIRHSLTYELGRKQGRWQPRSKYCDLIINGEYLGLYALTEKIKPDKNRLNISKLTETDLYGDDVTGGYIFWKLRYYPPVIYYPSDTKIQEEQKQYLESHMERYENLLFSNDWLDPNRGYRNYIETESLLDYLIINELTFDHDKYAQSTYMYKDRNDKDSLVSFGPLWDYNYAYGNTYQTMDTDKWRFHLYSGAEFRRYFQDVELAGCFAEKWHEQRSKFLHLDSIYALIDSLSGHFERSRIRDSIVWGAYSTVNIYFANDTVFNYEGTIRNLKNWIRKRVEWIDGNIDSIYYPLVTYSEDIPINQKIQFLKVYPNPFENNLSIELSTYESGSIRIELLNIQGILITSMEKEITLENIHSFIWQPSIPIASGIYLLNVKLNGRDAGCIKVIRK